MPKTKCDKLVKKLAKRDGWSSPHVAVVLDGVKCLWGMDDVSGEIVYKHIGFVGSPSDYEYDLVKLAPGSTDDDATLTCEIQAWEGGKHKVVMRGRVVTIEEVDVDDEEIVRRFEALVVKRVTVDGAYIPVGAPVNPMDDPEGTDVWSEPLCYELEKEARASEGREEEPGLSKLERIVDSCHGTAMAVYQGKLIKDEIQFVVGYIMACELGLETEGVEMATVDILPVVGATEDDAKLRLKLDLDGTIVRAIWVEGHMTDDDDYDTFMILRMSHGGVDVPVDPAGTRGAYPSEYHISDDGSLELSCHRSETKSTN